jgi:glycosyltransferase involved in cell wall biosynthesis
MRVLFLCATREWSNEYSVHKLLAEHVDSDVIDSYFLWQDNTHNRSLNRPANLSQPGRNHFFDFGRNMALKPAPPRRRRAMLMAARLPVSFAFLVNRIKTIRPDIIYTSQQFYDVQLARILSSLFNIPHIIHLHYLVGPWLGRMTYRTILHTPRLIAVSEFIRRTAIDAGVAPRNIHTLLNPVDARRFHRPKDRAAVRQEFGLSADTLLIVASGRLDRSKGHMLLLDSFQQVRQQLPNVRLLICGTTTTRDGYDIKLRRRAADLGLGDTVIFAGFRQDMPAIYTGADVFCLPAESEPFGLVFLEAMAAGLPVVACRSGGVPEIVLDEQTGLMSDVGDVSALTANLLQLLTDKAFATKLGEAGRERAVREFAPDSVGESWVSILRRFLASSTYVLS